MEKIRQKKIKTLLWLGVMTMTIYNFFFWSLCVKGHKSLNDGSPPLMSPLGFVIFRRHTVDIIDGGLFSHQVAIVTICHILSTWLVTSQKPRLLWPCRSLIEYWILITILYNRRTIYAAYQTETSYKFEIYCRRWLCRELERRRRFSYRQQLRPLTLSLCFFKIRWSFEISINHFSKINEIHRREETKSCCR